MTLFVAEVIGLLTVLTVTAYAYEHRCRHTRLRCTHGDEIIARGYRRRICLDCGRALDGPLPERCYQTGGAHS